MGSGCEETCVHVHSALVGKDMCEGGRVWSETCESVLLLMQCFSCRWLGLLCPWRILQVTNQITVFQRCLATYHQ